jgi:CelD/BcsL family acetyltransferase involved in cellulose biosynthesis
LGVPAAGKASIPVPPTVAPLAGAVCRDLALHPVNPGIWFGIGAVDDVGALARLWTAFEPETDATPFTSWSWLGNWVAMLPRNGRLHLGVVQEHGAIMALGLLWSSSSWRRVIRLNRLLLHECGVPEIDSLCIECNGLLARRGARAEATAALLHGVLRHPGVPRWDELVLPGFDEAGDVRAHAARLRLTVDERVVPSYFVDLAALRTAGKTYLEAVCSKTRRKIRGAMREYEERYGNLQCDLSRDVTEAEAFMAELMVLHQANWVARGQPGVFANPRFVDFHRRLIRELHERGGVRLLRVRAGGQPIGLLYLLIHDGVVSFYQSGYRFGLEVRHEIPGLVAITAALECLREQGCASFEFLAGRQQYKSELGLGCGERSWLVLQRPRLALRVERAVRQWRRRLPERWRRPFAAG